MRILIVGGGIAGLTLAALLRERGMHPDIVESTAAYGGVGYVLALWPAGSDILKGLGLHASLAACATRGDTYEVFDARGRLLNTSDFASIEERFGSIYFVERTKLIDVLRLGAQGLRLRMGVTVEQIEDRGDAVHVTFTHGGDATYDLVVGADGVRSRVRSLAFGEVPLRYLGLTGWAFWLPADLLPPGVVREYWGAGQFVGLYPAPGVLCSFVATPAPRDAPDPIERRIERLRDTFGYMGGQVPTILREVEVTDAPGMWHDDFLDVRMERWHRGRVVLLGDAAHAILPTAGVGASMAMESAAVLADELTRTDSRYLPRALERFEARRKPRVDRVQRDSRFLGKIVELESRPFVALRDTALRLAPETTLSTAFDYILRGPI